MNEAPPLDLAISAVRAVEPAASGEAIAVTLDGVDGRALRLAIPVEVGEALIEQLDHGLNRAALARRERDEAVFRDGSEGTEP